MGGGGNQSKKTKQKTPQNASQHKPENHLRDSGRSVFKCLYTPLTTQALHQRLLFCSFGIIAVIVYLFEE